jgi:hypothetical protein
MDMDFVIIALVALTAVMLASYERWAFIMLTISVIILMFGIAT